MTLCGMSILSSRSFDTNSICANSYAKVFRAAGKEVCCRKHTSQTHRQNEAKITVLAGPTNVLSPRIVR